MIVYYCVLYYIMVLYNILFTHGLVSCLSVPLIWELKVWDAYVVVMVLFVASLAPPARYGQSPY